MLGPTVLKGVGGECLICFGLWYPETVPRTVTVGGDIGEGPPDVAALLPHAEGPTLPPKACAWGEWYTGPISGVLGADKQGPTGGVIGAGAVAEAGPHPIGAGFPVP